MLIKDSGAKKKKLTLWNWLKQETEICFFHTLRIQKKKPTLNWKPEYIHKGFGADLCRLCGYCLSLCELVWFSTCWFRETRFLVSSTPSESYNLSASSSRFLELWERDLCPILSAISLDILCFHFHWILEHFQFLF